MKKRIVIHVGIHKTGSTSIQDFLGTHRTRLRKLNCDFFSGEYLPNNHVELHLAAMNKERASPFKLSRAVAVDEAFQKRINDRVSSYIAESPCHTVIFSAEGLSYLRDEHEMDRLKACVPNAKGRNYNLSPQHVQFPCFLQNHDN